MCTDILTESHGLEAHSERLYTNRVTTKFSRDSYRKLEKSRERDSMDIGLTAVQFSVVVLSKKGCKASFEGEKFSIWQRA